MLIFSKFLSYLHIGRRRVFEHFVDLFSFFYIRMHLILNIGLNLLNWLFVYIVNVKLSQDLVVLHYNVDFGVNLIGDSRQIYVIPGLGLVIIVINLFLLSMIGRENRFFGNLLLGSALLVNLILLLATASVYLINFYR